MRTAAFRSELFRQALMLVGVFLFDWSALEAAVFVLLEVFLFLSCRAAAEITLEPRFGVIARTRAEFAWELFKHWLAAAAFIGLIVFALAMAAVLPAFPDETRPALVAEMVGDPWFYVFLAVLVISILRDTMRFAARVAMGRSAETREKDDEDIRAAFAIAFVMAIGGIWFGVAAGLGLGPRVAALGVAAAVLYVEAAPRRATRMFTPASSRN